MPLFRALILLFLVVPHFSQETRKRHRQGIKAREMKVQKSEIIENFDDGSLSPEYVVDDVGNSAAPHDKCPLCSEVNPAKASLDAFWNNNLEKSFACGCNQLLKKSDDGLIQALIYSISQSKYYRGKLKAEIPSISPGQTKLWEMIGPITVGKMEIDGDPIFDILPHQVGHDIAEYLLKLPQDFSVISEIVPGGKVSWQQVYPRKTGEVDIRFDAPWNELAQGLSTVAAYEFQAWLRSTTFVKSTGSYLLSCQGTHTVYLRNSNITRVLVSDVYRANKIVASVDLRAGLVGFVLPVRGVAQAVVRCELQPLPTPGIAVEAVRSVPDLLELPEFPGKGLLISNIIAVPVQNTQAHGVTVDFSVDKPLGEDAEMYLREARIPGPLRERYRISLRPLREDSTVPTREDDGHVPISIPPGQTLLVPLELLPLNPVAPGQPLLLSCRRNRKYSITVTPSRGQPAKVDFEFPCRRHNQSFSISYVDHDQSVAQAAIVLPLNYHTPDYHRGLAKAGSISKVEKDGKAARKDRKKKGQEVTPESSVGAPSCAGGDCKIIDENFAQLLTERYPVLLSLHGSGISHASHADAHKMMVKGKSDYVFGVDSFWIVAPSRFGAHNWEAVGELSARMALLTAAYLVNSLSHVRLPKMDVEAGMVSGHSMGGHGAWIYALNAPDAMSCLFPLSGWIKKEEYGSANSYFQLDISNSYVEPELKTVIEKALQEFHADRHISNYQLLSGAIHLRVGSSDMTTHPWYTRRMQRLLQSAGINSSLEEVAGKQHWWWDSLQDNDGGVVNDGALRGAYERCYFNYVRSGFLTHVHASMQVSSIVDDLSTIRYSNLTTKEVLYNSNSAALSKPLHSVHRCHVDGLTLTVVNPAMHLGLCGLRVIQQHKILAKSTVSITCRTKDAKRSCSIETSNVRRLQVKASYGTALYATESLTVNGKRFVVEGGQRDICIFQGSMSPCASDIHPLLEKSLANSGPVRLLYAREFYVVYGTPQDQALRIAMKDLAVYIGNQHAVAHDTTVRVLSDLEYKAGSYSKRATLANIMFIGGPTTNKLLKLFLGNVDMVASAKQKSFLPVQAILPGNISFVEEQVEVALADEEGDEDTAAALTVETFSVQSQPFRGRDHAIIFSMPFHRPSLKSLGIEGGIPFGAQTAMGVCIHANSAEGYLHVSRLAWPVIPPMVRAPFANYIPDFVVIDKSIWSQGFGGVQLAGYFDSDWRYDDTQSYRKHNINFD